MVRTVPNLALGKRKSMQERLPAGAEWISFKCLHPPPVREPWESRTMIFNPQYQAPDKCLLKEIKD